MDVLKLSDGTVEMVDTIEDFSDLLDRKLGMEVRNWFDDFVNVNKQAFSDLYQQWSQTSANVQTLCEQQEIITDTLNDLSDQLGFDDIVDVDGVEE